MKKYTLEIVGIVVTLVIAVVTGIIFWRYRMKIQWNEYQLRKTKAELVIAEMDRENAVSNVKVEDLTEEIALLKSRENFLAESIRRTEFKIEARKKKIEESKSWDDLENS